MIRSFIAADLPQDNLDRLAAFIRELSKHTKGFSWVDSANIHLTLRFLGEIEESVLKSVADRLKIVCSQEPMILLTVQGVGFFPSEHKPRIVWAGLKGEIGRLQSFQQKIEAVLEGLDVHPWEDREFKPHLTIARIKDFRSAVGVASILQSIPRASFGEFTVKSVFLYKSDLTPKGPRYTKLSEFHLQGETLNGHQS